VTPPRKHKAYRYMTVPELTARLTERVLEGEISEEERLYKLRRYMPALEAKAKKRDTHLRQHAGWVKLIDPLRTEIAGVTSSMSYFVREHHADDERYAGDEMRVYGAYRNVLYELKDRLRRAQKTGVSVTDFKAALIAGTKGKLPRGDGDHWIEYVSLKDKERIQDLFGSLNRMGTRGAEYRIPFQRNEAAPRVRVMRAMARAKATTSVQALEVFKQQLAQATQEMEQAKAQTLKAIIGEATQARRTKPEANAYLRRVWNEAYKEREGDVWLFRGAGRTARPGQALFMGYIRIMPPEVIKSKCLHCGRVAFKLRGAPCPTCGR
jgi:hypothetical protein